MSDPMEDKSKPKVWTLWKGMSKDALKDTEWIDMMQVVLGGANRNIIIEIREVADGR